MKGRTRTPPRLRDGVRRPDEVPAAQGTHTRRWLCPGSGGGSRPGQGYLGTAQAVTYWVTTPEITTRCRVYAVFPDGGGCA